MPKSFSAKTVLRVLQKAGFTIISQKGSHIKLTKQQSQKTLTVIVPNHHEIAIGTFHSILKQSGMTQPEFEKLVK